MGVGIKVTTTGMREVESSLAQLPFLIRGKELQRGMTKGAKRIADRAVLLVPFRHKRPASQQANKHLSQTIGTVYREYSSGIRMAVVGPQYPVGAHGHLVERGHRIVKGGTVARQSSSKKQGTPRSRRGLTGQGTAAGRTRALPFLEPAAKDVEPQVEADIIESLQRAVARISK